MQLFSGVPQSSVLVPLQNILYTADLSQTENIFVCCADDSTLISVCCTPAYMVSVSESVCRDRASIDAWCSCYELMLNIGKTKSVVFSRSRTAFPTFIQLVFAGGVVEEVEFVCILGVILDTKMTF